LEVLQGPDHSLPGGVKEGFMVGAVVEEEGFVQISGAEMPGQQRQDPVFRRDFTAQHAAQIGKPCEPL